MKKIKKINVLSLFDGISCGQVALQRAKIKVNKYYASEIDKNAIQITQKNYPNTIQLGDVTKVQAKNLEKIDLLIGGSPCQGFSFAGKQLNFNDPRSKLFFEYVRLLKEIRKTNPDVKFLLENVKMKKEYQDVISKELGVEPVLINSSRVSAQKRERLYWTNIKNIKKPKDKKIFIDSIKENETHNKYNLTEKASKKIEKYSKNYICCGKSPTLTTELAHSTGSNITPKLIKEIGENRRATPIECERLQTLPDNYTNGVSDTARYHAIGNGWTVDVIVYILRRLNVK